METRLSGLKVVERQRIGDQRGFFSRFFCSEELADVGFSLPIAQINHTLTIRRGTLRGMHFQFPPYAEDKFVSCLHGEIFDVVVDLRSGSPTFLQWHAEVLSGENGRSLLIPQGFAHGFQTLTSNCELLYLHSQLYAPDAEGGVNARDSLIGIPWPLEIIGLSDRDANHPFLTTDFGGI